MSLELILIIALVSLGIALLLVEFFLLPGVTIAGIAGGLFLVIGVIIAYSSVGALAGNISVVVSAVALGGLFTWFVRSKALKTIGLKSSIEETVDNSYVKKTNVGDRGVSLSRLNPIGKVMINDVEMEGKSFDNEYIPEETEVKVVKVNPMNVLVKRVESATASNEQTTTSFSENDKSIPLSARLRSASAEQLQD